MTNLNLFDILLIGEVIIFYLITSFSLSPLPFFAEICQYKICSNIKIVHNKCKLSSYFVN